MTLSPGTRLGPFDVIAALGAGGMGEVYRARDTKLGREVAIKVVLPSMVADAERTARFRREAQVLASLNHPNIATLFGLEEADGRHVLVMELIEGPTLGEMIDSRLPEAESVSSRLRDSASKAGRESLQPAAPGVGPRRPERSRAPRSVKMDDALAIARQIADALEAAHEAGVVHRDLKPANIKVRPDGTVKVLDFGLAKALDAHLAPGTWHDAPGTEHPAPGTGHPALAPTMTSPAVTSMGMILGTAAYMSPEQARGRPVDRRADIWAFGVILLEMLTGRRTFEGDDVSSTLANVLKDDIRWDTLPASLPPSIRRLLRRCLEKDPRKRLSAIGDARLEIDDATAPGDRDGAVTSAGAPAPIPAWRRRLPYAVAALGLAAGGVGVALWMTAPAAPSSSGPVSRFVLPLAADAPFVVHSSPGRAIAVSADGTQIAYTTHVDMPDTRIRVRRLDTTDIRPIPGTERGRAPFFSPDGLWLAYFDMTEQSLKKVSVQGGSPPVTLQRGLPNAGWTLGSWCDDGRVVFDTWNGGLRVVGGDGSGPRALTEPTDEWHLDPQPLPGPCRVLFYTYRAEGYAIHAISVDGGASTKVLDNASHGRYVGSGHLLFVRDGVIHLAPFDPDRLAVTGPAVPAPIDALPDWYNVGAPTPQIAVSQSGTLVYAPREGSTGGSPIVSVTHDGRIEEIGVAPFFFPQLSLAPNGEDLALSGRRAGRALVDTLNLTHRATATLVDLGIVDSPSQSVWTPDGKAVLYGRFGPFDGEIVRHELDGRAPDTVVARISGTWICPWSVSPDGRWLIVQRWAPESQGDLLLVDLQAAPGTDSVKPLVATLDEEGHAAISPDGRWVAYTVVRGERRDVMIDSFPEGGQRVRVAPASAPAVWSPRGDEIYVTSYVTSDAPAGGRVEMLAVRLAFTPRLSASAPRRLFSGSFMTGGDMGRSFVLTPDGKRFLMVGTPPGQLPSGGTGFASRLIVVQNWFAELRAAASR